MLSRSEGGGQATHLVNVLGVRAPVSVFGTRDERIAGVANLQRGRVTRAQLVAAGVSEGAQARMIARGALIREHHGVYRVGHCAPILWGAETAALLACAPGTVLSHRSAAVLWGLLPAATEIEVTIARAQTGKPDGVVVHRSRTLLARDVTIRNGLPVTSVARTLLDLAGVVKARLLEKAVDQALLTHLVTLAALQDVLGRSVGRRGAATLKRIVEAEGPSTRTRSDPEERFLALVRQAGLPAPEVNGRIQGYEVDFLWRAQQVALEIDTWGFHRTRNASSATAARVPTSAPPGCVWSGPRTPSSTTNLWPSWSASPRPWPAPRNRAHWAAMLSHELMPGVSLRLIEERDAEEMYALVDANRAYLARWMPWAAGETIEGTRNFIRLTRTQVAENDGLNTVITVDGRIAGTVGMRSVEWRVRSTEIGYWLAEVHQGRGIVTAAVGAYLDYAFGTLDLHRVAVKAGVTNARSRAIAERLGFTYEGTEREAEWLGERVHDLAVYSMLAPEWAARTPPGA